DEHDQPAVVRARAVLSERERPPPPGLQGPLRLDTRERLRDSRLLPKDRSVRAAAGPRRPDPVEPGPAAVVARKGQAQGPAAWSHPDMGHRERLSDPPAGSKGGIALGPGTLHQRGRVPLVEDA